LLLDLNLKQTKRIEVKVIVMIYSKSHSQQTFLAQRRCTNRARDNARAHKIDLMRFGNCFPRDESFLTCSDAQAAETTQTTSTTTAAAGGDAAAQQHSADAAGDNASAGEKRKASGDAGEVDEKGGKKAKTRWVAVCVCMCVPLDCQAQCLRD
jgi:hypothetical protein